MENLLFLSAAVLCGIAAILSLFGHTDRVKKLVIISWCLSVLMIVLSVALMISYQVSSNFEYQYIYSHTSLNTDLIYKISSLWSGQEGSFLLWALLLGIMGFFILLWKGVWVHKSFGIYSAISFCIFMMCYIIKPFAKMESIPLDGLGLNEALKDPWMIIHPPLVFISYSAMAILFSLSAALKEDTDSSIIMLIRTWQRISLFFLGIGILSGSIWAYRALGWGGYWAWDPIENAALVPWLILCGLLHRKEYQGKSNCIVPFSIACFGVFLARSGILKDQSAHAYTEGNKIITGIIIFFLLGVIIFLTTIKFRKKNIIKIKKRSFTFDNRLMIYCIYGYAALIFLATVAPIILKYNTPIAFYTTISIIFAISYSLLLLLHDLEWLKKRNILMMLVSTLIIAGIIILFDSVRLWWLLLLWICLMPLSLWLVYGFRKKSSKYYLSHIGVLFLIIGAISSSVLGKETFVLVSADSETITIEEKNIPIAEFTAKDTLIVTLPMKDLVIQCSNIVTTAQNDLLIPYSTKPLIMLFWIGGFMIICQPIFSFLSKLYSNFRYAKL